MQTTGTKVVVHSEYHHRIGRSENNRCLFVNVRLTHSCCLVAPLGEYDTGNQTNLAKHSKSTKEVTSPIPMQRVKYDDKTETNFFKLSYGKTSCKRGGGPATNRGTFTCIQLVHLGDILNNP